MRGFWIAYYGYETYVEYQAFSDGCREDFWDGSLCLALGWMQCQIWTISYLLHLHGLFLWHWLAVDSDVGWMRVTLVLQCMHWMIPEYMHASRARESDLLEFELSALLFYIILVSRCGFWVL